MEQGWKRRAEPSSGQNCGHRITKPASAQPRQEPWTPLYPHVSPDTNILPKNSCTLRTISRTSTRGNGRPSTQSTRTTQRPPLEHEHNHHHYPHPQMVRDNYQQHQHPRTTLTPPLSIPRKLPSGRASTHRMRRICRLCCALSPPRALPSVPSSVTRILLARNGQQNIQRNTGPLW